MSLYVFSVPINYYKYTLAVHIKAPKKLYFYSADFYASTKELKIQKFPKYT